ncbi:MAG: carbonate dehydratase [Planctomycetota bacterium]|nr:carbonate dehydratase [Planctomycetota bacterium]
MNEIETLLENNRRWSARLRESDPKFFARLAEGQAPRFLWIGCADSRVPGENLVDLPPGGLFVHRNIANVVIPTDMSCMSVLQYAVDVLKVPHIILCGHYGCGGIQAALQRESFGLIDTWLTAIKDLYHKHSDELDAIADPGGRLDRMCELNVHQQVANLCATTIVQEAWGRGQALAVHGWIYNLKDGLLRDLNLTVTGPEAIGPAFRVE